MKQPFLSPAEAQRCVLAAAAQGPQPQTELVPLDEAVGRIAARTFAAQMDQPPFDRSPLDGYALHSADLRGASRGAPRTLPVVQHLYAGDPAAEPLPPGTAARIMAGAPLPPGADCVVMQEHTDGGEQAVQLYESPAPGSNICTRGEDIARGTVIAAAGTPLTAAHIGVLAGQGCEAVEVYRRLTVGVLATGSELLPAGAPWTPGRIYDANGAQTAARLREMQFLVRRRCCSDDPEQIAAALRELLARCDAVITSGGVSVGQKDYLPQVLERLGANVIFQGVAQKPGSPMIAATVESRLVFCLSGNPFAAAATLEQYALPALLRASGRTEEACLPRRVALTLTTGFSKPSKNTRFLRAKAEGGCVAIPGEDDPEAHSSGSLSAMIDCNCLVELPADSGPVRPGTQVEVLLFVH
ncbi:MAG: gephyrin-like molybdotransferase Glp [Faecalibacterium sp.]